MTHSSHPDLPEGHPPIPPQSVDPQRMGWRDVALWGGAGLVMLVAHGAGAYALRELQPVTQTDGAPPAAIMMELAPEPMAPMAEEAPMLVPEAETEEAVEDSTEPETAEPVEEVPPETPPQEIAQAEPVEEVQPEEEPVPDVVEAEKPEVVVAKPVEKPEVVEKPKPKAEKPKRVEKAEPKKQEKPKPKKQAAAPQVDAAEGPKVAASRNSDTSGDSGRASEKWQAKVFADIKRQQRYAESRAGGAKGRVPVNFSFDALGNVLSVRASGDPALARLAEEMVRRASPIPAPPPAITRRAITIPIVFQ